MKTAHRRSQAEMAEAIRSLRDILKPKAGAKPFSERWADYKRAEKELEEDKFWRMMHST